MKFQCAILVATSLFLSTVFSPVSSFAQSSENIFVYGDALPDAEE